MARRLFITFIFLTLLISPIRLAYVISNSMYPTIEKGDLIVYLPQKEYKEGDIVVYKENSLIVHRIYSINDKTVITKGDNNNTTDKAINYEQIQGKVKIIIPKIGYLISYIDENETLVILGLLSLVYLWKA